MKQLTSRGFCGTILGLTGLVVGTAGCTDLFPLPGCGDDARVQIKLINDSTSRYVAPNLGICPNGMASQPHHFVKPAPLLAPGQEVTYTSCQIAGSDGSCTTFSSEFSIGLCGWQYGPSEDELTSALRRFGGQIGTQFGCGDTVILRWSDNDAGGGSWTSEVEPASGNNPPAADFQEL
jgi:hypothetical protein